MKNAMSETSSASEQLSDDLKAVASDAEALLNATAGTLDESTRAIRERLTAALQAARVTGQKLQEQAVRTAQATDEYIRDNPYQSMGVAFGVGLLIGFILKKK